MASRGNKRPDSGDEFPVDKRACSSMGSKPSSSNQPPQIADNASKSDSHVRDMEASSAASASHRSDDHDQRDDSSYDSDNDNYNEGVYRNEDLARVQKERSLSDQEKIKELIPILNNHSDPSAQLVSLTQLCEVLSFSTENSFSSSLADQLASVLVRLANHESSPDIMLMAIRAITYFCDVSPLGLALLVRHGVVPALCGRLIVVEYLDVAEQCFQALKRISRDQPHICLQSGAIMAVLGFLDFFSTNIQRTALSTVINICNRLPSDCPAPFMGAIPKLCDLLQYEDQQLVESAIICLIKIADRVKDSPESLKELCKHGLVQQTVHLIGVKNQRSLSQTIYSSLIGLLAKLVAVSTDAVTMIFELDIGSTLKVFMSTYDLSHGMPFPHTDGKHSNQLHEFIRFLNELLPPTRRHQEDQLLSAKEKILADHPDGLRKFGMQVLPFLIQVGNSGENISVCYGSLSIISKLVYHSKPEMLLEMIGSTGMPSFLMSAFARKDHHILALALEIIEMVLQKVSDIMMASFAKEGIFFAIDALLNPEKCSMFMSLSASGISIPSDFSHQKCLCYVYSTDDRVSTSETKACKLDKDSAQEVAKRIREKYSEGSVDTDLLQNLREASCELNSLINDIRNGGCRQSEEKLNSMLHRVMVLISGDEPISTFELIESGIIKALMNYLYIGLYEGEEVDLSNVSVNFDLALERFKMFARLSLSSLNPSLKDSPLCLLVQKLQVALSTMDRFAFTSDNKTRPRTSYASIPHGRHVPQSCLRVCFKRAELEKDLGEYSEAVKSIDPFCSVEAIKSYLYPKIAKKDIDSLKTAKLPDLEEETEKAIQTANLANMDIDEPKSVGKLPIGSAGSEHRHPMEVDDESESSREGTSSECSSSTEGSQSDVCSDTGNDFSRLAIYLEGSELDDSSTLYHKVLQQRMKSQDDIYSGADVWSEVYTLTYKIAADTSNNRLCQQYFPFSYDIVVPEIISGTVRSSPTNDIVFLLRSLEIINRYTPHLGYSERVNMFAKGKCNDLHSKSMIPKLSQNEFVNSKLSEKLEQQMRNPLTVSIAAIPLWCNWLICTCPFLFTLEARRSFFQLAACGRSYSKSHSPLRDSGSPRKKFLVSRDHILESATRIMEEHGQQNTVLEVEYHHEVGTGLGPTLEFYTLVCHEFQKPGLGMWREDYHHTAYHVKSEIDSGSSIVTSSLGLFPRPWSKRSDASDIIKRFHLLGWIVAKALHDGRVLDIPFSKAFFRLILCQDLSLYDIQSFDPVFGKTLLEFHAIISRQKFQIGARDEDLTLEHDLRFRGTRVEDLSLDFTLPGYPDYLFADEEDHSMVTIGNLKEYVSLVVDATLNAGIYRQVEAFKSGFNKVFPINHLRVFNEEELERLLCGECDSWVSTDLLDHCKIDHGYTASSTHILYLLEIIQDFSYEQRRAFLQFVTGAPRLPPGGLSALNPKLTIVRKISSNFPDSDLPSVMTCTNYLKLPPYSSKEMMKEKLLYAITEGQGAFHLS